jgi:teichoic acid transport system ATP-binding protein
VADTRQVLADRQPPLDPALTLVAQDAHVTYRVYEDRRVGLQELVSRGGKLRASRAIKAVKGVSFEARAGEVIGVIGANGSGKSTLLQAMAGLLPCTDGAIYARSQPVILGVGAALQPLLSGRRNVELGLLALGASQEQVEEQFDEVVEFSGLEDSIDLPLRTYSSGMKARLHFAIATSIKPDLLLIDEALAVGDADFRVRSEERIRALQAHAGTVFIVSHRLSEIQRTCTRVLWLCAGELAADGAPGEVLAKYREWVGRPRNRPPRQQREQRRRWRRRRRGRRQERRLARRRQRRQRLQAEG